MKFYSNTNPLSLQHVVALRMRRYARMFNTLAPSSPCAPSVALIMNWYKPLFNLNFGWRRGSRCASVIRMYAKYAYGSKMLASCIRQPKIEIRQRFGRCTRLPPKLDFGEANAMARASQNRSVLDIREDLRSAATSKSSAKIEFRWKSTVFIIFMSALLMAASDANAFLPVPTDSRIKTFVYNENDVFHIVVHYGYQSSIEFAKNEEVEATSLGNSYAWKYSTIGRRLFITALEGAAHTNMTVITNKRTYQFDIESKDPSKGVDDELVYVVRFFYPDADFGKPSPKVDTKKFLSEPVVTARKIAPEPMVDTKRYNFNYSLTGPDSLAPLKVFDDTKSMYLKFKDNNANIPNIFVVQNDGSEVRATYSREGEYIVIKKLVKKLALRLQNDLVYVFNDGGGR